MTYSNWKPYTAYNYTLRVGSVTHCTAGRNKREAVETLFRGPNRPACTKSEALRRIEREVA